MEYLYIGLVSLFVVALLVVGFVMDKEDVDGGEDWRIKTRKKENGTVNIGIDFLDKLARAFDKKVEIRLV